MPLIVLTASSILLVIVVSISSALAPGRNACTETTGASVFGIRSRPSSPYDTGASTMSGGVIMMAKTGRLTLTSASFMAANLEHHVHPVNPLNRRLRHHAQHAPLHRSRADSDCSPRASPGP